MPKTVRNQYGVESTIPDDYPQDLIRQLGLAEVQEEDAAPQEGTPQEERSRRRK